MGSNFKNMIDCPCGCEAYGVPDPRTGHPRDCVDSCRACAYPQQRSSRSKGVPKKVTRQLAARSAGVCEAASSTPEGVCTGTAEHAHHRRRKSQGGRDTLGNLIHVCARCHDWIHANVEASVRLGLLEHTSADNGPLTNGVTILDEQR